MLNLKNFIKRNFKTLILLAIFIGFLLRLIAINQSLWLDEAISFNAASLSLKNYFAKFALKDFNPPFYYLVLHYWLKAFPKTELFLRLPSIIFGVLTGIFIYKIYNLVFSNKKQALLSLILLLTSPLHIYYSQEARVYALSTLLVSASIYYFMLVIKNKRNKNLIFYTIFTLLMLYSHYLSFFIIFLQFLYSLVLGRGKLKKIFLAFLAIFILYLPWLPTFFKQLSIGNITAENKVWVGLGSASLKNVFLLPIKFIIGRISYENKGLYYSLAFVLIAFFSYLFAKAFNKGKFLSLKKIKAKKLEALIWFWLIVPTILGIIVSIKVPIFTYFRFLFCLPAFYILIAKGALQVKGKTVVISTMIFINVFFSFQYLFITKNHRENWKEAVKTLHEQNINNAPILILQNVAAPFEFYDRNTTKTVYFKDKKTIISSDTVFLIPYAQPIFDSSDSLRKFLRIQGFERIDEEHFRGVTLEKWQKHLAFRYN
ncbi:glycosyltransferase family 39 protein [Patescibacteria group bacterium]